MPTGLQPKFPANREARRRKVWRPSFSDIIAIGALIVAAVMWLVQPDWRTILGVSAVIIALVIFAAVRHQSHPVRRWAIAVSTMAVYVIIAWGPLKKSFLTEFTGVSFQWPIDFEPKLDADSEPNTDSFLLSRLDRFIFACNLPRPSSQEEEALWENKVRTNITGWGDTIGMEISFSKLKDGIQVTVEATSDEAKAKLVSLGVVSGVTKIFMESRWLLGQQIVVIYAKVPAGASSLSMVEPPRDAPEIIKAQDTIAQFIGAPKDACRLI